MSTQPKIRPVDAELDVSHLLSTRANLDKLDLSGHKRLATFRIVPQFSALSDRALIRLAAVAEPRSLEPGDTLFLEEDFGDEMMVLEEGDVEIRVLGHAPPKGAKGRDLGRLVATLGKGTILGEISVLSDRPRTATAVAATACKLLTVQTDDLKKAIGQCPDLAFGLFSLIMSRASEGVVKKNPNAPTQQRPAEPDKENSEEDADSRANVSGNTDIALQAVIEEQAGTVEDSGLVWQPAEIPEKIKAILKKKGIDKPFAMAALLRKSPRWDFISELAQDTGITEQEAYGAVAALFKLPAMPLDFAFKHNSELLQKVPLSFAESNIVFPIEVWADTMNVAISDPLATETLSDLKKLTGLTPLPFLMEPERLLAALTTAYEQVQEQQKAEGDEDLNADANSVEDLRDLANQAPVIRLVNRIFREAIEQGASDIHIEAYPEGIEVRYRVDGSMSVAGRHSRRYHAPVTSRLKIMAGLDIAERRLPMDGRIKLKLDNKDYDIRVATTPTVHGEGVVMRILDKSNVTISIEKLGLSAENILNPFKEAIAKPNGIMLVTGPTGSGKTTTLYAALNHINMPDMKIITVEDPVEYQLKGVNQIQVNAKIELTFARALRSILRQDPDVVMIGEIRDAETSQIAVQAALTGHLVLSTLHTNDAPSAITRLVDMGTEPFLVASSVNAVLAQRLCRRLHICKKPDPSGVGFTAAGCPECERGYKGRVGIHELLVLDEEYRALINKDASAVSLKALCRKKKMRFLMDDGMEKARAGLTTVAEVASIANAE